MVKIIIEIKEDKQIEREDLEFTKVDVDVAEIGTHATDKEMEVLKEYRKRLQIENKFQFINKSKKDKEKALEELINNLFN